jgi:hypothetical protein
LIVERAIEAAAVKMDFKRNFPRLK